MSGFLQSVSILFLIFEKGNQRKNCARFFKMWKYNFLIFEKGDQPEDVAWFLRFLSMLF